MEGTGKIRPLFGLNVSSLGEVYVSEGADSGSIREFPNIRGTLFWGPENKDPTI